MKLEKADQQKTQKANLTFDQNLHAAVHHCIECALSLSLSLLFFLPRAHARTRSPRNRARTREPARQCNCTGTGAPDSSRACLCDRCLPLRWMFAQRTPASAGDCAEPRRNNPNHFTFHLQLFLFFFFLTTCVGFFFCCMHLFQDSIV